MSQMETTPQTPGLAWLDAVARAFHPARWGLCLLGLAASFLLCLLAQAVFEGAAFRPGEWWQQPLAALARLGDQLFGKGSGTGLWRCSLLAGALSLIWSLVGAWIARSELLRHRGSEVPIQVSATLLVREKAYSLWSLSLFFSFVVYLFLLPGLVAGLVNHFVVLGVGAVLVSLVLPVILLSSLLVVLILLGGLSYGLMPTTIAAEGSDSFDAIARAYSYLLQRPLHFAWWWGLSLGISSLPLVGVIWLLPWALNLAVLAAGAALSLSLFWTLQSLVYLKMRRLVDKTAESEVWDGPLDQEGATSKPEARPAASDPGQGVPEQGTPAVALNLEEVQKLLNKLPSREREVVRLCYVEGRSYEEISTELNIPVNSIGPILSGARKRLRREEVVGKFHRAMTPRYSGTGRARGASEKDDSGLGTAPEPVLPKHTRFAFRDTLVGLKAIDMGQLVVLFLGVSWTALVLAGGALVGWAVTAGPGQAVTAEGLRKAVVDLARKHPETLLGIAAAVVVLGALGLAGPIKMAARLVVVRAVFQKRIPGRAARSFARSSRRLGIGSVLLVTVGIELFLATGFLVFLALQGKGDWDAVMTLAVLAMVFLGTGALGLGAVAVDGRSQEGTVGSLSDNSLNTIASVVANVVWGPVCCVVVLGLAWLTWLVMCESLSWWGGEKVHWVRWGLDGGLVPAAEDGLYQVAWVLAGGWFLVLVVACGFLYPISYALTWGVACYLLARQQTDENSGGRVELTAEEREAVQARRKMPEKQTKLAQAVVEQRPEEGTRS